MAVYKLFPYKTATLQSENNTQNSGLSEIFDLSKRLSLAYPSYSAVGRALIKFADDDINFVVSNYIISSSFSASIKLYLANASAIPVSYNLECFPVSGNWDIGTGRLDSQPIVTNGVCWKYQNINNPWPTSFSNIATGSYFTGSNPGGGVWYISSSFHSTQSFNMNASLDVNIDVTNAVTLFSSHSLKNDGFIIKNSSAIEFNPNYQYKLTYFAGNTNTIYPPCLELKWNDSIYAPDTGSMSMVGNNAVLSLGNNKGEYSSNSIVRFNINTRDQYPQRTFVTSSLFTINKYLPSSSYYSITDVNTNNIIVNFDENFTKISTDQNGSFFNLYMNGFEPQRYYSISIMIKHTGQVLTYHHVSFFKVYQDTANVTFSEPQEIITSTNFLDWSSGETLIWSTGSHILWS